MSAHGRFGGHIVQGHVDGVGRLEAFERIADSDGFWLHIQVDPELEKYLVYKGSIAIEGISLTVANWKACVARSQSFPTPSSAQTSAPQTRRPRKHRDRHRRQVP